MKLLRVDKKPLRVDKKQRLQDKKPLRVDKKQRLQDKKRNLADKKRRFQDGKRFRVPDVACRSFVPLDVVRMLLLRFSAFPLATSIGAMLFAGACSNGAAHTGSPSSSSGVDAGPFVSDASPDGVGASDAGAGDAVAPTQALVRVANLVPDGPAAGFDVCLAPAGTTSWMGPLLQRAFAPGSLGQGGPNGIEFSAVSAYFPVPPGTFDLQVVSTGATDCSTGAIAPTRGLPTLVVGARATFALIGDARPIDNDAAMKVAAFLDEASAPTGDISLRVINAVPSIGFLDVGTGSIAAGTFSPLFADVAFGTAGIALADGGSADPDGYTALGPIGNVLFSAHASGIQTADRATASHVTVSAGDVTTMMLINGKNGGTPPQFLVCADNGPALGAQSPCKVIPQ
jgi:hypothetical protein